MVARMELGMRIIEDEFCNIKGRLSWSESRKEVAMNSHNEIRQDMIGFDVGFLDSMTCRAKWRMRVVNWGADSGHENAQANGFFGVYQAAPHREGAERNWRLLRA